MLKVKAVTVTAPGKMILREFNMPKLAPRDMIIKIGMCGICGTDQHMIASRRPFTWEETSYPFIPGHEFVGIIHEMGDKYKKTDVTGQPLEVGDLVAVCPADMSSLTCGTCYYCKSGLSNFCVNRKPQKLPPLVKGWQKGYAEYRYINAIEPVYKLPKDMPLEVAVLTEPLSIAVHAFQRACQPGNPWLFQGMGPGQLVVIQGSGPIGLLLTLVSKLCGAWKTVVIGAPENRLEMCREFGADATINIEAVSDPKDRSKMVNGMTPLKQGADVVIEAAGVPAAFTEGIEMVRKGGVFVELGHFTDRGVVEVKPFILCSKEIRLFGMFGGGPSGFLWSTRILQAYREKIPLHKIVTHKFPLEKFEEALETAKKYECMKAALVP